MRAIVNPLHDPAVDLLWAEADGLGAGFGSKFLQRVMRARQRGGSRAALKVKQAMAKMARAPVHMRPKWMPRPAPTPAPAVEPVPAIVSSRSKLLQAVMKARQRGGPRAALKVKQAMAKWAPAVAPVTTIAPVARAPVRRRRRRRLGWAKRRAWRRRTFGRRARPAVSARRARFGLSPQRWRQLTRKYEGGLSGIDCDELENLAGLPDDEPFTLGDDLGDLGGFFSKVKKAFKKVAKVVVKVTKKSLKVTKKIIKSKAFKYAAIGAAAWFAGPAIIGMLASKTGLAAPLVKAALKRGAQRLGKTGAVAIGPEAATNAAPAPAEAVDYDAILQLGLQPQDMAASALMRPMANTESMAVVGERGGPKPAGMNMGTMIALGLGGVAVVAVMASGRRGR